jgi:anti-sigma B factor antagonist
LADERETKRLAQLCSARVERDLDTVLIRLHGEFDLACERPFLEELEGALDGQTRALVLDLGALKFIDSIGLRMLVTLDAHARADGLDFTVLCGEGEVRRVLRKTGLDGVLPLVGPSGRVPPSDSPI